MLTKKEKVKVLGMLRRAFEKGSAIRKVATSKKFIGTKHEERLHVIADELEGQIMTLAEELGFDWDEVI